MTLLLDNLSTIIIGVIVFGMAAFALRKVVKDRKKGACCGGCSGCAKACICSGHKTADS